MEYHQLIFKVNLLSVNILPESRKSWDDRSTDLFLHQLFLRNNKRNKVGWEGEIRTLIELINSEALYQSATTHYFIC